MSDELRRLASDSSLITHHSSPLLYFPVNLQGHAGRVPPVEGVRPSQAALAKLGAEGVVVNESSQGACERARVEGVCGERRVADDLRQTRAVADECRGAATHGFERGQSEAFKVRRVSETGRPCVQCRKVGFGYVAGEDDPFAESFVFDGPQRLAVEPSLFAYENQFRQITPPALANQERIRAHQPHQILP